MRYAVVENGVVTRLVMWDGSSPHNYRGTLVLLTDSAVDVNYLYDGQTFTAPDLTQVVARAAARDGIDTAYTALRAWADDAETAVAAWDGWTSAQRFAALKTAITRLGVFFDRFADLLQSQGKD